MRRDAETHAGRITQQFNSRLQGQGYIPSCLRLSLPVLLHRASNGKDCFTHCNFELCNYTAVTGHVIIIMSSEVRRISPYKILAFTKVVHGRFNNGGLMEMCNRFNGKDEEMSFITALANVSESS